MIGPHKIHAMPEGDGTARLTGRGYQSLVRMQTIRHERDYHDLWAFSGEFKTARQLVRALVISQDRANPEAVY